MLSFNDPVTGISSVNERTAKRFEKNGVKTVGDLLEKYPRKYEERPCPVWISAIDPSREKTAVCVKITSDCYYGNNKTIKVYAADKTGSVIITWFHMPYITQKICKGGMYVFLGPVSVFNGRYYMAQPEYYSPEEYAGIMGSRFPVYSVKEGMTSRFYFDTVLKALAEVSPAADPYGDGFKREHRLISKWDAIRCIHWPADENVRRMARRRLVFDEFYSFIKSVKDIAVSREKNPFSFADMSAPEKIINTLPYELTGSQKEVWATLKKELCGEKVAARLVQGDVGSGKTIVAILCLAAAAGNGYQAVVMAPTDVLARQHYAEILERLESAGLSGRIKAALLCGSMKEREKKAIRKDIKSGKVSIIAGTHSLIQEGIEYDRLAVAVIDEQHRFGVEQRQAFTELAKGALHTVIMTATPIPRTTASILFGGLNVSVMRDKPANRLPIISAQFRPGGEGAAYKKLLEEISAGRQGYIICPLVEGDNGDGKKSVEAFTKQLQKRFPSVRALAMHGKMGSSKKEENMNLFAEGGADVLISTTVIEVGVNVPNATVMIIEGANMFGLLQLHQLRGRVGRGNAQSFCFFVNGKDEPSEKLDAIVSTDDGFEIARADYRIRKGGDLLGTRQSGDMGFKLADIVYDENILAEVDKIFSP